MATYRLERSQTVRLPLGECWQFFSNPRNLEKITPPQLRFRILEGEELPAEIRRGLMIAYKVSPVFRLPLHWLTEITEVRAPHYFCDEQRAGPYKVWHHEHFFQTISETATEVRDVVHYVPPLGPVGAAINALVIRRQLKKIFDYRARVVSQLG